MLIIITNMIHWESMTNSIASPEAFSPVISYEDITERHESTLTHEIQELKDKGVDFELNYKVAFTTWLEIRRARGMIMQSTTNDETLKKCYIEERVETKLNNDQIDRLANLVTLSATNCGVLFWTRDLTERNRLLSVHTEVLKKMKAITGGVSDQDSYSAYGNAQVMYTFNSFLAPYFESGPPKSDNLGDHFPFVGPHPFLDRLSISKLRGLTREKGAIVIFAAAASSGVLEAGIFAHYMSTVLKIPTTVDPVFFLRWMDHPPIMSSVKPHQEVVVIPFDDQILGSGFSPRMAREAATTKYGKVKLRMSPRMANL